MKGSRRVNSPYAYYSSRPAVQALNKISRNSLTHRPQQRKKTRKGCLDCDIPLYIDRDC
ncbi:uncharacterized protein CTRU02_211254 [Colletotrichum truncatum]|uniref:Uncharacterized protein n=1 Tax=Colletotrichum truncatum TaxID=5467 RepID=A0ACC3YRB8_COLTU|nr:uncharacterized protein CTRU02_02033 [Colletotrichum truncatum]KAF6799162.1 hypothetical protein CTRU02_02033 [Colletotrichum truncatum]